MKKIKILFIGILVVILLLQTAFAAQYLKLTLLNQDPDPVDANQNVELKFKLENLGSDAAQNTQVELVSKYPYILESDAALKNIGTLDAYSVGTSSVTIKYNIRIDKNAADGVNKLEVRYKYGETDWISENYDISVSAENKNAFVSVNSIEITPESPAPGNKAQLKVMIQNYDESEIKDVTVKLDVSSATLPFVPYDSSTEKRITILKSKEIKELDYDLLVSSDAKTQVYKIPLTITFKDYNGNEYTQNDLVGVEVGSAPELSYWLDVSKMYTVGAKDQISLKFVNKGISDMKFLYVEVKDADGFEITSSKKVYLGNVNSDDYETADFDVMISNDAKESLNIPVKITYKDANNNNYEKEDILLLKLYTNEQIKSTSKKSNTGLYVVIGIIVIVILFLLFRRSSKKK
ncbi:MAG: COG1361 S-layer family protein [Candidatus Woesearchaeota archaeon]|jgi:hypothetical protein